MSRRDDVLEALRAAGGAGVSGETLAAELGVSRMAVSKHVSALREAGYDVASRPGAGYVLLGVPDAPLPAQVARLVGPDWVRLEGGGVTGSTNADAVALARAGAPHATAVLASRQTAGKGRLGRSWASPEGGVYVSAVLRPALVPADLAGLPLAVAVGVAGELGHFGIDVSVKWPNDLLTPAGKLGGILLEMAGEADRTEWVVVGVGLNVHPFARTPGAAYLADEARSARAYETAAAVLDGIACGYRMLVDDGFAAVRDAFARRDALAGTRVRVHDADGRLRAEGVASGIDGDGRLVVETAAGPVALAAGDVTLAPGCDHTAGLPRNCGDRTGAPRSGGAPEEEAR